MNDNRDTLFPHNVGGFTKSNSVEGLFDQKKSTNPTLRSIETYLFYEHNYKSKNIRNYYPDLV